MKFSHVTARISLLNNGLNDETAFEIQPGYAQHLYRKERIKILYLPEPVF